MANNYSIDSNNLKIGGNHELIYGEQIGTSYQTERADSYYNIAEVNLGQQQGSLLNRLNQFDHNPMLDRS